MLALITAGIGLLTTLIAYLVNPQRRKDKVRSQLIRVYQQLDGLERKRDEALHKQDNDALTNIVGDIIRLRKVKADLLQQLG